MPACFCEHFPYRAPYAMPPIGHLVFSFLAQRDLASRVKDIPVPHPFAFPGLEKHHTARAVPLRFFPRRTNSRPWSLRHGGGRTLFDGIRILPGLYLSQASFSCGCDNTSANVLRFESVELFGRRFDDSPGRFPSVIGRLPDGGDLRVSFGRGFPSLAPF